jgi:hypothetical protein
VRRTFDHVPLQLPQNLKFQPRQFTPQRVCGHQQRHVLRSAGVELELRGRVGLERENASGFQPLHRRAINFPAQGRRQVPEGRHDPRPGSGLDAKLREVGLDRPQRQTFLCRETPGLREAGRRLVDRGDVVATTSQEDRVPPFAFGETQYRAAWNPFCDCGDELVRRGAIYIFTSGVALVPK